MFESTDESTSGAETSGNIAEVSKEQAPHPLHVAIEEWFAKHFHGLGPRLDESLYNHIHAAKEDLKALIVRVHQ